MVELPNVERAPSHVYKIAGDSEVLFTGRLADGRQVLMGLQIPDIVAFFFTNAGEFETFETQSLTRTPHRGRSGVYEIDDSWRDDCASWGEQLDLQLSPISVKRFASPARHVRIYDLPDHYRQVIEQPHSISPERQATLCEDVRSWMRRGDFVLFFNDEIYLSREGEILST